MQRRTALLLGAALAVLAVLGYAVATLGFGLSPTEAGAAVAGVALAGFVEVVLDESSV